MRKIIRPGELDLDTPGRRDYLVAFDDPSIWAKILTPLSVWVGPEAKEDRGVVAFGATHGNEYEGPVAIKKLLQSLDLKRVLGRIVLVPTLNVPAFRADRRDTPEDGVNLNRAFIDNPPSTITHKIASFVRHYVFPKVHVVLDIHSGGLVQAFSPLTSFHKVENKAQFEATLRTASLFGAPYSLVAQDHLPGLLTTTAEGIGKITIGGEFGHGESLSLAGVGMVGQGIWNSAIFHGQLEGKLRDGYTRPRSVERLNAFDPACTHVTPHGGIFEPLVALGAKIRQGEIVAQVHDFERIDAPPTPIRAAVSGRIISHLWRARVGQGHVACIIGKHARN